MLAMLNAPSHLMRWPARVHGLLIVTELSNKWQEHAVRSVVTVTQLSGAPWLSAVQTVMVCRSHSYPARRRPRSAIGICQPEPSEQMSAQHSPDHSATQSVVEF